MPRKRKNRGVSVINMMHILKQFIFGVRVFFNKCSFKTYLKMVKFIYKRYILGRPIPFAVILSLTYKCQCNCIHCFVSDYDRNEEDLTTEEIISILNFIDSWGSLKITFFGGEPLLREDLIQLVGHASKKGIRISIDTNGILLDEAMLIELKNARVANINISLDSADEEIHDDLRQKKGCFRSAVNALELCVKHSVPCLISTYASRRAIKEKSPENLIRLGKQIGARGVKILFPILSGKWRDCESERLNREEEEYVKNILDRSYVYIEDALEMINKKWKGCSAIDRNIIYISPYGDIQPCAAIPVTFGNIRDEGIDNIVKRMEGHSFFKKFKSCKTCLMNDNTFRHIYYLNKITSALPIDVQEFKL